MKKIELIHKEVGSDCQEVIKEFIVEDADTGVYTIDKNTLLENLPRKIVDIFLDLLSKMSPDKRSFTLYLIKKGSLVIKCTED